MTQVNFFSDSDRRSLERDVNSFLMYKDSSAIKTISFNGYGAYPDEMYYAMVVYETND